MSNLKYLSQLNYTFFFFKVNIPYLLTFSAVFAICILHSGYVWKNKLIWRLLQGKCNVLLMKYIQVWRERVLNDFGNIFIMWFCCWKCYVSPIKLSYLHTLKCRNNFPTFKNIFKGFNWFESQLFKIHKYSTFPFISKTT